MRRALVTGLAVAMALLIWPMAARAATITFDDAIFTSGAGLGTVPVVLVIQDNPTETGAVSWSGSADVESDDAKSQSRTWTVAGLAGLGITADVPTFGLVLNINESGTADSGSVEVQALQMDFFSPAGVLLFSAPYTCVLCGFALPLTLEETAQGTGSSGFLFEVTLTPAERALFFGAPGNRLGLAATIGNSLGGPETFYLATSSFSLPLDPLAAPEPTSMLLLGTGLAGLAIRRFRSRRS